MANRTGAPNIYMKKSLQKFMYFRTIKTNKHVYTNSNSWWFKSLYKC